MGAENPLGKFRESANQGFAPVEIASVQEAKLAEQFMLIAMRAPRTDGLLSGWRLPVPLAVLMARKALEEYGE